MKRFLPQVIFVVCLLSVPAMGRCVENSSDVTASADPEIVRRALPFLEKEGQAWMEERKCVSCHQVPSMVWSLRSAAGAGLLPESDKPRLAQWIDWSRDWQHWLSSENKKDEEKAANGSVEMLAMLVLGRPSRDPIESPWAERVRGHLLRNQQQDGAWKAGGQFPLAKRPAREIQEVSTMWCLLAVAAAEPAGQPDSDHVKRAQEWLASGKDPGRSIEWHMLNVLLKQQLGPAEEAQPALDALLKLQNLDGGWPWLAGEASDALGTGYALYAAAHFQQPANAEARNRAIAFLQKTQNPDGSWAVPSTRAKDKNKVRETTTYWGTAWAVIGLLEGQPGYRVLSFAH